MAQRKRFIEAEIHSHVESLKAELNDYEQILINKLSESCINAAASIKTLENSHQNDLQEIKHSADVLKSQAFSYADTIMKSTGKNGENISKEQAYLNILPQQTSVDKCFNHMATLNRLNNAVSDSIENIKFYPNIEPIGEALIGKLQSFKKINLETQFKAVRGQWDLNGFKSAKNSNKRIPIAPHHLCILDENHILVTDAHSKQIIQMRLDTGDYVSSTNLKGSLKCPDGICINQKKGFIFVVDSDLGCVFKLDKNLNVIRQFGGKDLRWPRGICYDHETNHPNSLYVCDYLNQRVAIFNDQDQLRDEIVMSVEDRLVPSYNTINNGRFESCEIEEEFKFCPMSVLVHRGCVYVTDDWSTANCIRVFDKGSKALIRNIGSLQTWNPVGFAIDDDENVFTLAKLFYETGTSHLFCFDKNGKLLYRTNLNLNENGMVNNFVIDRVTDKECARIVACGDTKIYFFTF